MRLLGSTESELNLHSAIVCLLKRTSKIVFYHNLGLGGGPNFRWQYIIMDW